MLRARSTPLRGRPGDPGEGAGGPVRGRTEIWTSHYNEALEEGGVHGSYRSLLEVLERLGQDGMQEGRARAGAELRRLGANFPLPGDPAAGDRVLPAYWAASNLQIFREDLLLYVEALPGRETPCDDLGEEIRGFLIPED